MEIKDILFKWQTLIGSAIGAASPLLIWFVIEKISKEKGRREKLRLIHRLLATEVNRLNEFKNNLDHFFETKLDRKVQSLKDNTDRVDIGEIFLPISFLPEAHESFISTETGSGLLDNQLSLLHGMIQDIRAGQDEMRHQLRTALEIHRQLCVLEKGNPQERSRELVSNLEAFKKALSEEEYEKNLPTILKALIFAMVVTKDVEKHFVWYRTLRFKVLYTLNFFRGNNTVAIRDFVETYYEKQTMDEYTRIALKMGLKLETDLSVK